MAKCRMRLVDARAFAIIGPEEFVRAGESGDLSSKSSALSGVSADCHDLRSRLVRRTTGYCRLLLAVVESAE